MVDWEEGCCLELRRVEVIFLLGQFLSASSVVDMEEGCCLELRRGETIFLLDQFLSASVVDWEELSIDGCSVILVLPERVSVVLGISFRPTNDPKQSDQQVGSTAVICTSTTV
jgi:hypothetical protein